MGRNRKNVYHYNGDYEDRKDAQYREEAFWANIKIGAFVLLLFGIFYISAIEGPRRRKLEEKRLEMEKAKTQHLLVTPEVSKER